ncbi:MAG TPA: hypothetical protein VF579_06905 [Candidatus Methylomirabilis sp.]
MKKKSLREWIKEHRIQIDAAINAALYRHDGKGGKGTIPDPPPKRTDTERAEWIANDEGLYDWARSENVNV